jgi:hypothetical protein
VTTLVARNTNEAVVAPIMGSGGVCVWRESGIRRSVCVAAFGRKFASIVVKVFSHLIYSQYNFINVVLSTRFTKIMLQHFVACEI